MLGRRDGLHDDALGALREGRGDDVRTAAPTDDELATRLRDQLAVSRNALTTATAEYERRRWAPGKLEPIADAPLASQRRLPGRASPAT